MTKYAPPAGYQLDNASGRYYTQTIEQMPDGSQIQQVIWFNCETGQYTKSSYTVSSSLNTAVQAKKRGVPKGVLWGLAGVALIGIITAAAIIFWPKDGIALPSMGESKSPTNDVAGSIDTAPPLNAGGSALSEISVEKLIGEIKVSKPDSPDDSTFLEAGTKLESPSLLNTGFTGNCILNLGERNRMSLSNRNDNVVVSSTKENVTIDIKVGSVAIDSRDKKASENKIIVVAEGKCNVTSEDALYYVINSSKNYMTVQVIEGTVSLLNSDNNITEELEAGKSYAIDTSGNVMSNNVKDLDTENLADQVKLLMDVEFANSIFG